MSHSLDFNFQDDICIKIREIYWNKYSHEMNFAYICDSSLNTVIYNSFFPSSDNPVRSKNLYFGWGCEAACEAYVKYVCLKMVQLKWVASAAAESTPHLRDCQICT